MGYRATKTELYRIPLAPLDGTDNWVDVKARRSYGDRLKANQAVIGSVNNGEATSLNVVEGRMVMFETCIVAWSLKAEDSDTSPMPLTRDVFMDLPEAVGVYLAERMSEHYSRTEMSDDDLKNSSGPSTGP